MPSLRLKCTPFLEKIQGKCGFCVSLEPLVLYTGQDFYIALSLGQIVEGYLLICTKSHRSCCGDIPLEQIPEFIKLKNIVKEVFQKAYNKKPIFYEHGQTGVCMRHLIDNMQNHCYHAHLHAVPGKIDIMDQIRKKIPQYIEIKDFYELIGIRNKKLNGGAYLFYENNERKKFIFPAENIKLPRQFLRRCVAANIDQTHLFDWEHYPGWRKLDSAYKKLRPLFQEYENKKI